jgi:Bacterial lipid A biosynthesis acyltransferase
VTPEASAGGYVLGDIPLRGRLYAVEGLHRLLPAAPAVALASLVGLVDRFRPARYTEALDRARTLVGDDGPGDLARRHLREHRMADELFWRPWLDMRLAGAEHLGRGQIIAGLHLGPMALLQQALARRVPALHVSRWRAAAEEGPQTGRRALYTPRKVARLEAAGVRVVPRGGSYDQLREALERGESVWMAADTAGRERGRETALLGRPMRLATGIAALACETGACVVPAYALRVRHRAVVVLEPPLDPAGFEGPEALHGHLAAWADATLRRHLGQAMPDLALTIGWS